MKFEKLEIPVKDGYAAYIIDTLQIAIHDGWFACQTERGLAMGDLMSHANRLELGRVIMMNDCLREKKNAYYFLDETLLPETIYGVVSKFIDSLTPPEILADVIRLRVRYAAEAAVALAEVEQELVIVECAQASLRLCDKAGEENEAVFDFISNHKQLVRGFYQGIKLSTISEVPHDQLRAVAFAAEEDVIVDFDVPELSGFSTTNPSPYSSNSDTTPRFLESRNSMSASPSWNESRFFSPDNKRQTPSSILEDDFTVSLGEFSPRVDFSARTP